MSHGNWKDLFKAAGEGDVDRMQYHLRARHEMDVNFQHPEYMSAPLFEAIHQNQLKAVKMLLQNGASVTLEEELSDTTPLEMAMQEKRHDIVDLLLQHPQLPPRQQRLVKTVAVVSSFSTKDDQLVGCVRHFLDLGHRVLCLLPQHDDDDDDDGHQADDNEDDQQWRMLLETCVSETGNEKLFILDKGDDDGLVHFLSDAKGSMLSTTSLDAVVVYGGFSSLPESLLAVLESINDDVRLVCVVNCSEAGADTGSIQLCGTDMEQQETMPKFASINFVLEQETWLWQRAWDYLMPLFSSSGQTTNASLLLQEIQQSVLGDDDQATY